MVVEVVRVVLVVGDVYPHPTVFYFLPIGFPSFEGSVSGGSGDANFLRLPGIWSGQLGVYLADYPSVDIAGCHRHIGGILDQNFILIWQGDTCRC